MERQNLKEILNSIEKNHQQSLISKLVMIIDVQKNALKSQNIDNYFSFTQLLFSIISPNQFDSHQQYLQVIQIEQQMSKIVFPKSSSNVQLKVQGIFATPEEWKATDDSNPGLFTYSVRFFQFQIQKGKIFPRQLTAKELRQQQQKNKKGGKKQSKKEDTNAEEQRIRKLEQEQERKRQQEWNKLPQQDKSYRPYEDSFRSPQLKFENGTKKASIHGKQFVILEQRVSNDHGEWIYVYKTPAVSEDELAKMRKSKPKTLTNVNDLNPVVMRAWVDLSSLHSKDKKHLTQRCKLTQIDQAADSPQPNLEHTYIKISITLEAPFLKAEDGVVGQRLIPDPPAVQVVSDRVKVVNELRDEVRLAITSLSMEYSSMFWKQLNIYEDFKNINYFMTKKNEITKRKEQFLYDFNVSGKYKILKDRVKKVIVHLCQSYFTQQMGNSKSFTGISCSIKDQFYSQIYNFLVTKYRQILQELIFEKKQNLKEVQVLSPPAQKKNVEKMLASYQQQELPQRIQRIIEQYQVLGNNQYGQAIFKKYMDLQPTNVGLKYSYSMYCLHNKLKKAEEILPFVEQYLSYNKDDQKVRLQYLLLLIASQNEQNCKKAWVLLRQLLVIDPYNTKNLMLASFLFKDFLNQDQIAVNLSVKAERAYLRQANKISYIGKHKQKQVASELPTLKGLPSYSESLNAQQKDHIWIEILNLFLGLNLYNAVQKITPKIKDTSNKIFSILTLNNLLFEGRIKDFQAKAKELYQKDKSIQILSLLVNCFISIKHAQTEKYLKLLLTRSKGDNQILVLLKMANYYLKANQVGNAQACILKYLQKKPTNSGYSWRILGICELHMNNLQNSLLALRKANILDIDNSDNWAWLSKVYALQGKYSMSNQCLNQYELMIGKQATRNPIYEEIHSIVQNTRSADLVEQKLRVQLVHRLS